MMCVKRVAASLEAAAFFVVGETNECTYAVNGASVRTDAPFTAGVSSVWTEADAGVLS